MAEILRVDGVEELRKQLVELEKKLRTKILRSALRFAAKPIVKAAKSAAPLLRRPVKHATRGLLRRKIVARNSKRDNGTRGAVGVFVGVRPLKSAQVKAFKSKTRLSARRNPEDPFYWRFVEFGTRRMRARPFLRPAFAQRAPEAVRIFSEELGRFIRNADQGRS